MSHPFASRTLTKKTAAYFNVHVAVVLFGGAGLFGKWIDLSSGAIVLGRAFLGAFFIFLFSQILDWYALKKEAAPNSRTISFKQFQPKSTKDLLVFGLLGAILAFHWVAFFEAIQRSTVAIGVLTFSTFPIFTTLLEPFFSKEKLQFSDVLLACIAFLGVLLVLPTLSFQHHYTQGALWGLAAGASFAILTLLSQRMIEGYSSNCVSFYQNGIAALFLLPFFAADLLAGTKRDWIYLLLLGLIFTAIAHTLFIHSMKIIPAKTASLIASLEPLYAIVFACFFLGEIPTRSMYLGGLMTLGVAFYAMSKNR
ncbi:MAG: EamA-like transporter family protein [uncultured Aureispira sp.]|uniref:EamA-like transporter family protein n=1 Tax=uncultured Aureispira sp. TaxID=1331704 RepID=A0A6S6TW01_9BACT|nr:MAG: EamA-like transporter family protein [uncultured Aureispira sp.]